MKKRIIAILTILTVAVLAVPASSQALTSADLQAQISQLTAQLSALQGQLNTAQGASTNVPSACAGITFNRNLSRNSSGNDVKCLQAILNQLNVNVADTGAGSPGHETTFFGGATRAAVIRFQELYKSDCLTPIGLTAGTGYVGSLTRAKLNAILVSSPSNPNNPNPTPTPTIVPISGTLSVALAPDNPVASTLVSGATVSVSQSVAPLAKFIFINGNNSAVSVKQLQLNRIGVSADTTLSNVYIFDGATRLTDGASVSSGAITFNDPNGLFTVPAGSSKTITVKADVAATSSGQTVGVAITVAASVSSTAATISGMFPINGNLMSIASGTLASVSFAASSTPTQNDSLTPQNDYVVWQNTVTVGSRAVYLNRISLREIGTINYSDLQNFRLFADGTQIGSAVANLDANGYVTFDLGTGAKLDSGNRVLKVMADIIGGSSRTFRFSIRTASDANFTDSQYNVSVYPTTNSSATTFTVSHVQAGLQTVAAGVLTIAKTSDSPSGNVVNEASGVTLATYKLTASGENIKIETLTAEVIFTDASVTTSVPTLLRNGKLFANGVQIGSTTDISAPAAADSTGTQYSLGSALIVTPGNPVILSVVADIHGEVSSSNATNGLASGDTLQVNLIAGSGNALGQVSSTSIDAPTSAVTGGTVTVATGSLTLAKYTAYTNQSMVAPLTAAQIGVFTLTAGTSEAVNINTITVAFTATYNSAATSLTNLYVKYGNNTTAVKPTVSATSNAWSVNYTLAAGSSIYLGVYADVATTTASYTEPTMTITGVTASSAQTANSSSVDGQVVAYTSGSFTGAIAGDTPLDQTVAGDKEITAAKVKFTAQNDSYTIKEITAGVGSTAASAAILGMILKDDTGAVLATNPLNTQVTNANDSAYFTGLSILVPANTNKTLTLDLLLSTPSSTAGTSEQNCAVTVTKVKYANSQGAITADIITNPAGNKIYVYRSIPTFTIAPLTSATLTNGNSSKVYSFSVSADAKGPVSLKQLKFSLAWNDLGSNSALLLSNLKFFRGSQDITSQTGITNSSATSVITGGSTLSESDSVVVVTFSTEETIPAGQTYTYSVYATPSGFVYQQATGYDSFVINLAGDTSAHNGTKVYVANNGSGVAGLLATQTGTGSDFNIIWSDNSATVHSSTAGASSNDWADGYLILNLPLDTQAWPVQ